MNRLRTPAAAFLLIFAAAVLLRFLYLLDFASLPLCGQVCGPDVSEYYAQAQQIRAGSLLPPGVSIHAPLYPYFLALVQTLSGGEVFLARLLQSILLALLTLLPVFRMLRRRTAGLTGPARFLPYAASFLLAVYPPLAICQCEFFSENLMIVLLLFSLWSFTRRGKFHEAFAGIFAGLAALAHPGCIFYLPLACGYAFLRRRTFLARARSAGLFLLGAVLMIAPVSVRNSLLAGRPVLIQDNSMFNLVLGNSPEATGTCRLPPGSRWDAEFERAGQAADAQGITVDHFYRNEFFRYLRTQPGHYLMMLMKKAAMTFSCREFTTWSDAVALRLIFWHRYLYEGWFLVLLLLGGPVLIAGCFRRHFRRFLSPELLLFASIFAGQVFFLTSGRYRMPLTVPLAVFAAYFLCRWRTVLGTPARAAVISGLTIALFLLGIYPYAIPRQPEMDYARSLLAMAYVSAGRPAEAVKLYDDPAAGASFPDRRLNILGQAWHQLGDFARSGQYYHEYLRLCPRQPVGYLNYASVLSDTEHFDEAEKVLNDGLRLNPAASVRADLLFNLGEIAQRKRAADRAEKFYLDALKAAPMHRRALNNLGTVYLGRRQPEKAVPLFTRALRQSPDDVRLLVNLGASLAMCGRTAEARVYAARALRNDPDCVQAKQLLRALDEDAAGH